MVAIAPAVLGRDFPILWGFLAFMLDYIPKIGSILAALPAMALALVQLGFQGALFTGIIYLVVNMLIGNVVEPKMMGKGLGLSTFIVFLSLIFWAFLLGTVGMFLSIPITMVIKLRLPAAVVKDRFETFSIDGALEFPVVGIAVGIVA